MERRKLDLDYIQLFPRAVEHGLAPQHVEQSEFVAECRYVEGFGDAWLLHQQKPPHLVAHVQFATDEADFDKKLGTAIALQHLHEYIEGNLTFFCMLAGINADEVPPTWPDRIRIPVRALSAATRWWHEYGEEALSLKYYLMSRISLNTYDNVPMFMKRISFFQLFLKISSVFRFIFIYLQLKIQLNMTNNQQSENYNRIKVVLVEQGKTSRWLAEQIGKQENTVSRWCLNKVQPSLPQLTEIARVLDVDVRTLICSTKG